jgi:hypothetical protein
MTTSTIKGKFLLFIHKSNSYFAGVIRDWLPKQWKNIIYEHEINDIKEGLMSDYPEQDYDSSSAEENYSSSHSDEYPHRPVEERRVSLEDCWGNACPGQEPHIEE